MYGRGNTPGKQEIAEYQKELEYLLADGYLAEVTYGFMRETNWVVAVKYKAYDGSPVDTSHDPGGFEFGKDDAGASFSSFLRYSQGWDHLPAKEQEEYAKMLPFRRIPGEEPQGNWGGNYRHYASGAIDLRRSVLG